MGTTELQVLCAFKNIQYGNFKQYLKFILFYFILFINAIEIFRLRKSNMILDMLNYFLKS